MGQGVSGVVVNQDRIEEECDVFTATSGAMADSIAPGVPFQLLGFELAINTAPTTSEDFTVTKNAGVDAAYDTLIYSNNLSVGSVADIVYYFDTPIKCHNKDDAVDFAFANTDDRTYGLTVYWRMLKG
jgi:hypothetical protein